MNAHEIVDLLIGNRNYCNVLETFDCKWSNKYYFKFDSINEAVVHALSKSEKGGIVIFSTDVSDGEGETVPSGISVGNFFKGRYKSPNGQVYNEKSISVEVLFINRRQLLELATNLAKEFHQETVLVKDNADNQLYLVNGD